MRLVLLAALLVSSLAAAHDSRVLGFITVDGAHANPSCVGVEQSLGHVTLDDGQHEYELPLTCLSAPALAFAADVPEGCYQVRVTVEDRSLRFDSFTVPTTLVVGGHTTLVTLEAAKRSMTSRVRGVALGRRTLASAARPL